MKLIQTVDAEGTVLCHDITQIIKGVTKGCGIPQGPCGHEGRHPGPLKCRERTSFMCGRRKMECFMRMMRRRFSATCAKRAAYGAFPGKGRKD